MKLLLADDEPDMIRALNAILTHEGYKVDAVYDGAEALEKAAAVSYDGLILDIMMPKLDGLAVLSALRDKDILTPVLLLTAKSQTEDKISGLDCGADDYLTKPFDIGEFLARVRALTRRSAAKQLSGLPAATLPWTALPWNFPAALPPSAYPAASQQCWNCLSARKDAF